MRRQVAAFSLMLMLLAALAVAQHPCGEPFPQAQESPPCHQQQPAHDDADRGCHPEGACTHACHTAAVVAHAVGLEIFGSAEPVALPAVPPPFAPPPPTIDHIPLA